MENKNKKKKILKILGIIGICILFIGLSYAIFRIVLIGKKKLSLKTANLKIELLDVNGNNIEKTSDNTWEYEFNLDNQAPIADEKGMRENGFVFKIRNKGTLSARYDMYLDDVALSSGETRMADKYVKYSLAKGDEEAVPTILTAIGTNPNRKLDKGLIDEDETIDYELHIWIDKDADKDAMGKVISLKLRVEASQYANKIVSGSFADKVVKSGVKAKVSSVDSNISVDIDGLYRYIDTEGTLTYAYRGVDPKNYVTFAGTTWRILRIQEDGTMKLIRSAPLNFESDKVDDSSGTYKEVAYNKVLSGTDSLKYSNSNVKQYIDEWYNSEMMDYDNKIAENDYCSDTTTSTTSQIYQFYASFAEAEDMMDFDFYGFYHRITFDDWQGSGPFENPVYKPVVSCRSQDRVRAKAALLTADEYILAGGTIMEDNPKEFYLDYDGITYQFMSPFAFIPGEEQGVVYDSEGGELSALDVSYAAAVIPVITLKANVTSSSGNGTKNNPYIID